MEAQRASGLTDGQGVCPSWMLVAVCEALRFVLRVVSVVGDVMGQRYSLAMSDGRTEGESGSSRILPL